MTFFSNPIQSIVDWLTNLLTGWNVSQGGINVILTVLGVFAVAMFVLLIDIFLVWMERKTVARLQDRLGPNRLGPFGLIQPFADVIKLLIKEDLTPRAADKFLYNLPPIIALATVLMIWAVVPFAPNIFGTQLNVGVLYIVAVGAISTLGIMIAGWASANKYALLGAFRTVAQMISFEVPMVLILLVPVILARSMGINDIVEAQSVWYVIFAPLAAIIFFLSAQAELGRAPFDLPEAESEIVAGFHIEYSGMKFGMFYAGELLHALTYGALVSSLFLGGWRGPGAEAFPLLGVVYLFLKSFFIYFVIMWVKYSMPRVRIDQMLNLNWKILTPLALALVIITAILSKLLEPLSQYSWGMWAQGGIFFTANMLLLLVFVLIMRRYGHVERRVVAEPRPIAVAPEYPAAD
jgi:NADH-quinone oxidoreductase subunit H